MKLNINFIIINYYYYFWMAVPGQTRSKLVENSFNTRSKRVENAF